MKALTISQPYASLIASGEKWIENRVWPTNYRGQLYIHAGKGSQYLTKEDLAEYLTGAIVATCNLVACYRISGIRSNAEITPNLKATNKKTWLEIAEHEHAEGPFCWILEDIKEIEPIYCSGKQGLWTPTPRELKGLVHGTR